jgi:tight adherence protein B
MRRRPARAIAALLAPAAALLLLLALRPASAAARLSLAPAGNPEFPRRAFVLQAEPPVVLGRGDVEVRENGRPVRGLRISSAGDARRGQFASVLAIDASLSMKGEAIREAMNAARAFAAHRAPRQELGAIAFNGSRRVLLPLSSDEAAIERALSRPPRLAGGTHLYDAVDAAVSLLENEGIEAGSVVVLSDGADTASEVGEAAVVRRAAEAGVRVFVVGLESGRFDPAPLRALARGGEYTTATDPRQLAPIFDRFGAERASEHLIRYRSQAEIGERVNVEARAKGVPGTARVSYATPGSRVPTTVAPPAPPEGFWSSTGAMLGAGALIALLFGAAVFAAVRPRRESVAERFARLGVIGRAPRPEREQPQLHHDGAASGPLAAVERSLAGGERWQRFVERLEVAGIDTPAAEVVAATAAATLLAIVLIAALAPFALLALLALLIPLAVHAAIDRRARRVRRRFADDLADNLQVVASAIRSGHSMVGALAVVAEEATGPARDEFRAIVAAERVGVPLEDSIRESARRMESRDMEQLALVAIIQRETGGNTAEVIDRAVETIRERAELRRMMDSLTAQGRLSRVIITALPIFLLIALSLINPGYLAPLFHTTGGQVLLAVAAGMVLAGSLVIKRIVEFRV